jgi:hypothetical protein
MRNTGRWCIVLSAVFVLLLGAAIWITLHTVTSECEMPLDDGMRVRLINTYPYGAGIDDDVVVRADRAVLRVTRRFGGVEEREIVLYDHQRKCLGAYEAPDMEGF